jgi:hypothetical protein
MDRPSRILLAVPAVATLGVLSVFALRWGVADSISHDAMREINTWTATRSTPGIDTWMWVRADLRRAERWAPSDPVPAELLGVLHLHRAGRAEFPELALEHFARALTLRPSSPYTWANVAEARYRLGMTSAPFEQILARTWELGPAEPEAQRLLAELGLAMWDEVTPATQQVVRAAIGAAMRRNPLETLQIAERRGRLSLACAHVRGNARLEESRWASACGA